MKSFQVIKIMRNETSLHKQQFYVQLFQFRQGVKETGWQRCQIVEAQISEK